MAKLAFVNIGILLQPFGDPQVRGFEERIESVFDVAERSQGFVALHGNAPNVPDMFRAPEFAGRVAQNLSEWQNLESLMAYAYGGLHGEAFAKRKEWIERGSWPSTAAWWVSDDQPVTWEEAHRRYELLHHRGSSPEAFNFKQAFAPDGAPYTVDRDAVKKIALENQVRMQVRDYIAAWNETESERRLTLLEAVFAQDGQYTDPSAHAGSRAELSALIGTFQTANPGASFTLEDGIDHHHGHLRFYWSLRFQTGVELSGMDYAERAADGRLKRIVGFFDA